MLTSFYAVCCKSSNTTLSKGSHVHSKYHYLSVSTWTINLFLNIVFVSVHELGWIRALEKRPQLTKFLVDILEWKVMYLRTKRMSYNKNCYIFALFPSEQSFVIAVEISQPALSIFKTLILTSEKPTNLTKPWTFTLLRKSWTDLMPIAVEAVDNWAKQLNQFRLKRHQTSFAFN